MKFVTIEEVRSHCKTDAWQDTDVQKYADRAEAACVATCMRDIFVDEQEQQDAVSQLPTARAEAKAAYDAAIEAAGTDAEAIADADYAYAQALNAIAATRRGKVAGEDFRACVLMVTGHFWRTREDAAAGQGASATKIPYNSEYYLQPYIYTGGNP